MSILTFSSFNLSYWFRWHFPNPSPLKPWLPRLSITSTLSNEMVSSQMLSRIWHNFALFFLKHFIHLTCSILNAPGFLPIPLAAHSQLFFFYLFLLFFPISKSQEVSQGLVFKFLSFIYTSFFNDHLVPVALMPPKCSWILNLP